MQGRQPWAIRISPRAGRASIPETLGRRAGERAGPGEGAGTGLPPPLSTSSSENRPARSPAPSACPAPRALPGFQSSCPPGAWHHLCLDRSHPADCRRGIRQGCGQHSRQAAPPTPTRRTGHGRRLLPSFLLFFLPSLLSQTVREQAPPRGQDTAMARAGSRHPERSHTARSRERASEPASQRLRDCLLCRKCALLTRVFF